MLEKKSFKMFHLKMPLVAIKCTIKSYPYYNIYVIIILLDINRKKYTQINIQWLSPLRKYNNQIENKCKPYSFVIKLLIGLKIAL